MKIENEDKIFKNCMKTAVNIWNILENNMHVKEAFLTVAFLNDLVAYHDEKLLDICNKLIKELRVLQEKEDEQEKQEKEYIN